MPNDIVALMSEHGFTLKETGGGCTAFVRVNDDGVEESITASEDGMAPTDMSEWVYYCAIKNGETIFAADEILPQWALCNPPMYDGRQ